MKQPMLPRLLGELIRAHRIARGEELAQALNACSLRQIGRPMWGVDFVQVTPHNYEPAPGGHAALIVAHVEDGAILDLVATGFATRISRTREGICTALGIDHIDRARDSEGQLRLFADPLEWLQHNRQGACVIDWRAVRHVLADVPAIACSSDMLAARVEKALREPARLPALYVREPAHAV